jgi:hypothetical protein
VLPHVRLKLFSVLPPQNLTFGHGDDSTTLRALWKPHSKSSVLPIEEAILRHPSYCQLEPSHKFQYLDDTMDGNTYSTAFRACWMKLSGIRARGGVSDILFSRRCPHRLILKIIHTSQPLFSALSAVSWVYGESDCSPQAKCGRAWKNFLVEQLQFLCPARTKEAYGGDST